MLHGIAHHNEGLWAKSLWMVHPLEREVFEKIMDDLPPSIFRMKGILEFSDFPHPMVFQYVGGRYELSRFAHNGTRYDPFLTIIGYGENLVDAIAFFKRWAAP